MRRHPAWVAITVVTTAVLLVAVAAHADGPRVAFVLRGAPRDEGATELLARVRGELRASRFDIQEAGAAAGAPPREVVEQEARHPGVAAAMGIFLDGPEPEIWVADLRSTRAIITSVEPAGADNSARALAAKAVDLLKAVLADVPGAEPAPPVPAPPPPAAVVAAAVPPPPAPPRPADRLLMVGAGWLRAGEAQTVAPLLSLSLIARHLGARATVSGLGSSTELSAAEGTAQVRQHVGLLELLGCLRPRGRLAACASAGGGAELLTVRGMGSAGFQGNDRALWSALGTVGAGLTWMPASWMALGVEARALGAWPSTEIRIDGTTVAHAGGPGVWVTAGVGARL